MPKQRIHFLTGKLAEIALREMVENLANEIGFEFTIQVMPITVAALMTPQWIAKKIVVPDGTSKVILPGYCRGEATEFQRLQELVDCPIAIGPKDLRRLPEFFGRKSEAPRLGQYNIEIIAEINHAPHLSIADFSKQAESLIESGANVIDVGCIPGQPCSRIADYVRSAKDLGIRVSIDSLDVDEISLATEAGAELVLSVNASNRHAADQWGCEVVVIPDEISKIESMQKTVDLLVEKNVPFRIDPILEPIGLGFADSLNRYYQARQCWPEAEIMMGIGNLTELTDVDSAGVNFVLLGICEELRIRSVLTTQVINWARSSVAECDIARRLVHFACSKKTPPKNLSNQLVLLRDARLLEYTDTQLAELATRIKDNNYRIFASEGLVHLLGGKQKFSGADPFDVFDQLAETNPKNLDASHAFYLGYEMCKAMLANQLGKNFEQDQALKWGHLTVEEADRHRLQKGNSRKPS